nr:SulP family inorganic anion transporter [Streptomyces sp. DSM 41633]
DPVRDAALSAVLALLVGAICLVAGLCRLGFLADLLSRPVLVGYMTGVAVIMISGQLGKISGIEVTGDEFVDQVRSFVSGLESVHLPTVALSVTVLVLLFVLYRISPRFPGPLVAVLAATAVVWLFSLDDKGIRVVGGIPVGVPKPTLPPVPMTELAALVI